MAETPTSTAPTVQQQGGPFPVQVPGEAFAGTTVGQGLAGMGQAIGKGSDELSARALELQGMNNKAAADQAWQSYVQQGARYAEQYKINNPGQAANQNLPGAYKDLEGLRTDAGSQLASPMARALFDQDSRRYAGMLTEGLSTFAASETKKWRTGVQQGQIDTTSSLIMQHPELLDDNSPGGTLAKFFGAQAALHKEMGLDPQLGLAESVKAYSQMVQEAIMLRADNHDIAGAQAMLDKYGSRMDPRIRMLTAGKLAPAVTANDAATDGDAALANVSQRAHEASATATAIGTAPTSGDLHDKIVAEAKRQGVDPDIMLRIAQKESHFDPNIHPSTKGAIGLFQLEPGTAAGLGVDPHDVDQNIRGGVTYYKQLLKQFHGDTTLAAAAYNAGPGRVQEAGGVPNIPETQDYVKYVTGNAPPVGSTHSANGNMTSAGYDGIYADTVAEARRLAQARHPGDAAYEDLAVRRATSQWEIGMHTAKTLETQSQAALAGALLNTSTQTVDAMINQTPGGLQYWNNLTGPEQLDLQRIVNSNAKTETLARTQNFASIQADYSSAKTGSPDALLARNPFDPNLDLTLQQRLQTAKYQDDIKAGQKKALTSDTAFRDALQHDSSVSAFANEQGLTANTPHAIENMDRFKGIYHGILQQWMEAHKGVPPTPDQRRTDINPLVFKTFTEGHAGKKDPDWAMATAGLALQGNKNATDFDIADELSQTRQQARAFLTAHNLPHDDLAVQRTIREWYQQRANTLGVKFGG